MSSDRPARQLPFDKAPANAAPSKEVLPDKFASSDSTRPQVRSCGVIVFRRQPELSFLLMKHANRWDLPKGHVEDGESDVECALRELEEETGIGSTAVDLDPHFRFEHFYDVRDRRFPDQVAFKTLVIFLGWLHQDVTIQITEHLGSQWFPWQPPHDIQKQTINPLLAAVEKYWAS